MTFSEFINAMLTPTNKKKLDDWIAAKETIYTGAIGGRLEYCFFLTTLGIVFKVKDAVDKTEIDLTDYDSW